MALGNIQSLKPKLDMLIHHMQLNNNDMCFVRETWAQYGNEAEHQYIMANLDTAGYNYSLKAEKTEKVEE